MGPKLLGKSTETQGRYATGHSIKPNNGVPKKRVNAKTADAIDGSPIKEEFVTHDKTTQQFLSWISSVPADSNLAETTGSDEYDARLCRVINHGQSKIHTDLSYNYHLTDLTAAIGRVQLAKLDGFNRQENVIEKLLVNKVKPLKIELSTLVRAARDGKPFPVTPE